MAAPGATGTGRHNVSKVRISVPETSTLICDELLSVVPVLV
jgi:hypothetical protein